MGEPGDPSSDLYALGIVLYELLTGHLPFEADTVIAAASRRMVTIPPLPSRYRADTPRDLEDVIMLTLKRDPAARPASVAELRDLLKWSRRQSPYVPEGPTGAWLIRRTEPTTILDGPEPVGAGDPNQPTSTPHSGDRSGQMTQPSEPPEKPRPPLS
jgi:serine/threonine-protein kinase